MEPIEIVAQAIGIVAMLFNIISFQMKTQRGVIFCQLCGGMLFTINFFMLGATVGGILNAIAVFRAVVFMFKDKFRADHILWLIGFVVLYLTSYVLTFTVFNKDAKAIDYVLEVFPVVAMTAQSVAFRRGDAKTIRLLGLISSPSWLVYNIYYVAVGAIVCEAVSIVSIIVGILRYDIKRNAKMPENTQE